MATLWAIVAALTASQQWADAEAICREHVAANPQDGAAWQLWGVVLLQQQKWAAAIAPLRRAVALVPGSAVWVQLGAALCGTEAFAEGLAAFEMALVLQPTDQDALCNAALALSRLGRTEEALARYRQLVQQQPNHGQGHLQLGHLYRQRQRYEAAIRAYRRAIACLPRCGAAWFGLGACWRGQGQWERARRAFGRAVRLEGRSVQAHLALAEMEIRTERWRPALRHYGRSLVLQPHSLPARLGLGGIYLRWERLTAAARCFRAVLQHHPDCPSALEGWLRVKAQTCDWTDWEPLLTRLWQHAGQAVLSPFHALFFDLTPATQQAIAQTLAQQIQVEVQVWHLSFRHQPDPTKPRLRLGYVSGDFRCHAVAHLMVRLFEWHDRARFEVVAYSLGPDDGSWYRQKLARDADAFVDVRGEAPSAIARRIFADGIDLAIDLSGYTDYGCPHALALRPAPVQVGYLGYPGTTGGDWLDYLIVDRVAVPPSEQVHFSETLAYLPHCYQLNDGSRPIAGDRHTLRQQSGLPPQGMVYCCFHHARKWSPMVLDCWLRVLQRVPQSCLWLLAPHPLAQHHLQQRAMAAGLAPTRLVFAPAIAKEAHLQRLTAADLALDTPFYNGHTSGSDVLRAGVPLLTVTGSTFAGRVGASLLQAANLPELIAPDLATYEELAVTLALDANRLQTYRQRLQQPAPLFAPQATVRALEDLYRQMWTQALGAQR